MKAVGSRSAGGPDTLTLEECPDPVPGLDEIVIDVVACGVNFPDLLLIQDLYQVKPQRPFSPGSEVAGIVSAVGPGVSAFVVGDRVIGRSGWGGMAERIVIGADRCTRIPSDMPFATAAAFLFTYATAYYALHTRAALKPAETVLVLGAAGGLGVAAIEIAKAQGARVIAAASSEAKLAFARSKGADASVLYPAEATDKAALIEIGKRFSQAVGTRGADIVFDPVGGAYAEQALRAVAEGARYLVLGFTAGIPRVPFNLPLLKNCDILGVNWRTFILSERERSERNHDALFALYQQGAIKPAITETYPLAKAARAIARLADRTILGKIVVLIGEHQDKRGLEQAR